MFKRLMALLAAWAMATATAYSHTNSIGYVSDASGNVTFWYGTYHYTSFNEAELKLEGANGTTYTTTITQFDELSSTTPNGLFPGTNYFTTDGTSLIAYSDSVAAGGQSNTWQGLTFSGLSAGDYTFTYIPLGNSESYQPNGTPTMDWAPWDEVIRTYTVTLNSALLSGDANQNGILDSLETSPASNSSPTVTSQGSSTVTANTATVTAGVQTVARVQTTTTWDNMSDGTTQNTQSSSTTLTPLTGRVDQHTQLNKIATVNRDVLLSDPYRQDGIEGKQGVFFINAHGSTFSMADGYDANSQTGGIEYRSSVNPGHVVGIMYNKSRTDLEGQDSQSDVDQTQVGLYSHYQIGNNLLKTDVGMINSQYQTNRSVGNTWNNQSAVNGSDAYLHTRLYVPYKFGLTPFVGYSFNQNRLDGYTETGDSVTARTVGKSETVDRAVEGGIKMDYTVSNWDFEAQLMRTSADLSKQHFGVEYNFSDSKSVGVTVINSDYKDMSAQTVMFALDINY